MEDRYEIRFSGSGGQGLILAGIILAEAAAIYDNKNALQSQSYGPEARGGASKAEVIISKDEIDYPKAENIDALISLSQEACEKYFDDLKEGGFLIVDKDLVTKVPEGNFRVYSLPFTTTAKYELGREFVANIIAIGATVELTKVVSKESIEKAVIARVPKGTEELNKKALLKGYELVTGEKR